MRNAVRLLAVAISSAVVVSGLPVTPAPLSPRRAEAQTGAPFVCDFPTGLAWAPIPTIRASVNTSGGSTTDAAGYDPSMSPDGRYTSFSSDSTQHVAGDTNASNDIFLYDSVAKTTERVSVSKHEAQALGNSVSSSVSIDGKSVAFSSGAENLVGGDGNTAVNFSGPNGRMSPPDNTVRGSVTLSLEAWFTTTTSGPIFAMSNLRDPTTPTEYVLCFTSTSTASCAVPTGPVPSIR